MNVNRLTIDMMEEILAKYFSEEVSAEEKKEVESWRGESEENAKSFLEAKEAWLASATIEKPSPLLLAQILEEREISDTHQPLLLRPWIKYASAAVLVMALALLFFLNQSGDAIIPAKTLSDGSAVFLHKDSKIETVQFDQSERTVKVFGKAYFDIVRDENRPFRIITENAEVMVLGTSFVVDTYGEKTMVTVASGTVRLKKNEEVFTELKEGQLGLITRDNTGIIKKPNSDVNYLAWKSREIIFQDATMQNVSEVLQDVYGVDIAFENPEFKNCKYTATLKGRNVKDVLEIISRTFGITYKLTKDKVTFFGKGC